MYRLPIPNNEVLEKYVETYSPILRKAIQAFIDNQHVLKIPMGHNLKNKHFFYCGLKKGSGAYEWMRGLLTDEKIEQLLIGEWDSMISLKDEIEAIQSDFRRSLSMNKYGIKKASEDIHVEDLNYILNRIFVDQLYEKELNKTEVIKMKGIRVCPYCGSDILKSYHDKTGKFIKSQLDHYLPKSKYPFLALNFFNLFPVCKDCNMADTGKGEKSPVSEDLSTEYLPYPHAFDASSFNFTCTYNGGDLFEGSSYSIDIDYHGNANLKKGYNEIIPIQGFYQDNTQIPVRIMTKLYSSKQDYIEITSKMTGIEIPLFRPRLMTICGFPNTNDASCRNEKHKFHVDVFNSLIRYI